MPYTCKRQCIILQKGLCVMQVRGDQKEVIHQPHQPATKRGKNKIYKSAVSWCRSVTTTYIIFSVPFLFNYVFEQDVLHMTIAEAAEQTGNHRPLRNPSTLSVCSEKQNCLSIYTGCFFQNIHGSEAHFNVCDTYFFPN